VSHAAPHGASLTASTPDTRRPTRSQQSTSASSPRPSQASSTNPGAAAGVPRIRTLKPEYWGDAGVAKLSRDARLLLLGLVSLSDDEGRFLASPPSILGYVFPNDDIRPYRLKAWLAEVEKAGLIHLYSVDGIPYGLILGWSEGATAQRINRPHESTLPPPQGSLF
jgi:hypothetical protein